MKFRPSLSSASLAISVVLGLSHGSLTAENILKVGVPGNIAELKNRASAEDFVDMPANIKGVVTWLDPVEGKRFYVQDESGGILVCFDGDTWPKLDALVEISGTLTRGLFSPVIAHAAFRETGPGIPPPPVAISWQGNSPEELLKGMYNDEVVEIGGLVRAAEMVSPTTLAAVISLGSDRIQVRISNVKKLKPWDLIAKRVTFRGVVVPVKARGAVPGIVQTQTLAANFPKESPPYVRQLINSQIDVAGEKDVHLTSRRQTSRAPLGRPLAPLRSVFDYRPGHGSRGDWVHVRGQVLYWKNGITYIGDGERGLAVRGVGTSSLHRGDWVEVVGFPDLEGFLPILADAMIFPAKSKGAPIEARKEAVGKLLDYRQHGNYVTVTGQVLDCMWTPGAPAGENRGANGATLVLALQSSEGVFTAELEAKGKEPLLPKVEVGSIVAISGICLVQTDMVGNPSSFKILVPSPDQITVVKPASFFTVKRLFVFLTVVLGVLLIVTWFTYFFARRNIRLQGELHERQAVAAERSRLARDLHDTLQQGLVGIQYHLQSIGSSPGEASLETQECLGVVRSLVRQCYAETRQSIWDLRSSESEDFDLGRALERAAQLLVVEKAIKFDFRQKRADVSIPRMVEDNLLRIGREALTNAVTHAGASHLKMDLVVTEDQVDLTIADDGCGMADLHSPPGHFGLQGMQERARRIAGKLSIRSAPGQGCSIHVSTPLKMRIAEPAT